MGEAGSWVLLRFSAFFTRVSPWLRAASLRTDVVESGAYRVVVAVVQPVWLDGAQAGHPIILAILEQAPVDHLRVLGVVSHLFNKRELRVFVEIVSREGEMMVKGSSLGFRHIRAMRIEAQVRRRFGLADILGIRAP